MNYTVNVTTAPGDYTLIARIATNQRDGSNNPIDGGFNVRFKGINITGWIDVPNTGGWQTWDDTPSVTVTLDSGPQVMQFYRKGAAEFNLNKFTLTYIGGNGDMAPLDGVIDLADFAKFASYWQQTACGTCGGADLTGPQDVPDGNVWIEDLEVFCYNWLGGL